MPAKKKSRSEVLNEELNPFARKHASPFDEDGPLVEDFDAENDADARRVTRKNKAKEEKLRRRGPLDDSLSLGKYAAAPRPLPTEGDDDGLEGGDFEDEFEDDLNPEEFEDGPIDEREIEGRLDALFDMFNDELEEGAEIDDPEEYTRLVESKIAQKAKQRSGKTAAPLGEDEKDYSHLDSGDAEVMRQIQALRATQKMEITAAVDESTNEVLQSETEIARSCVALTAELLAFRMKVQPALTRAIQLPQYYSLPHFAKHSADVAKQIEKNREAATQMTQQILGATGVENAESLTTSDKLWKKLQIFHNESMAIVHRGIQRWGHRASVATDPKLQAVNRPLLEQIQGVISGRQRLLRRAQRNRVHARIYGHPRHFQKTAADRAVEIAEGDEDREIFDDGDFVKEMAQQHGGLSAALENFLPEDKSKSEAKKGHHRRTKGRTVNYDPHPKLVGFMVSVPREESARHEALFKSLFGATTAASS